jgi:3-deoxy-D-manno-octulosonate 8-phosphate phosphatase (KDO 8-P phosphatase)
VKAVAHYITTAPGGQGAVREIAEVILKARGVWDQEVNRFAEPRGDAARRSAGSR